MTVHDDKIHVGQKLTNHEHARPARARGDLGAPTPSQYQRAGGHARYASTAMPHHTQELGRRDEKEERERDRVVERLERVWLLCLSARARRMSEERERGAEEGYDVANVGGRDARGRREGLRQRLTELGAACEIARQDREQSCTDHGCCDHSRSTTGCTVAHRQYQTGYHRHRRPGSPGLRVRGAREGADGGSRAPIPYPACSVF
eukprot:3936155-Rhodomonas_salina.1